MGIGHHRPHRGPRASLTLVQGIAQPAPWVREQFLVPQLPPEQLVYGRWSAQSLASCCPVSYTIPRLLLLQPPAPLLCLAGPWLQLWLSPWPFPQPVRSSHRGGSGSIAPRPQTSFGCQSCLDQGSNRDTASPADVPCRAILCHATPCCAVPSRCGGQARALPAARVGCFSFVKENVFLFPGLRGGRGSGAVRRVQQLLDRIRCRAFKDRLVPRLSPRAPALLGRAVA